MISSRNHEQRQRTAGRYLWSEGEVETSESLATTERLGPKSILKPGSSGMNSGRDVFSKTTYALQRIKDDESDDAVKIDKPSRRVNFRMGAPPLPPKRPQTTANLLGDLPPNMTLLLSSYRSTAQPKPQASSVEMFDSPEQSPTKSLKMVYSRNAFNDKLRANKTTFLSQTCKSVERLKDCERQKLEGSP